MIEFECVPNTLFFLTLSSSEFTTNRTFIRARVLSVPCAVESLKIKIYCVESINLIVDHENYELLCSSSFLNHKKCLCFLILVS